MTEAWRGWREEVPRTRITKEKRESVLVFVGDFIEERGYSPTVREICAASGIKGPASVHEILSRFERSGRLVCLRDEGGRLRGMRVV